MPQMNKGGKFIFGISLIHSDGAVLLPVQAVNEYEIAKEGKVILLSGSKSTGGFCVTRKGLLENSRLSHILSENPALSSYEINEGEFIKYKGRYYCWKRIDTSGRLQLDDEILGFLHLKPGMRLLSIRSSDIAFTMGAKGPLIEKSQRYSGFIPLYDLDQQDPGLYF